MYGPHYKANLERLKERISEFRSLTDDALKLASPGCASRKALRNLDMVQECASGLYDALRASWKCNCIELHPTNIKLDMWSLRAEESMEEQNETVCLKFLLLMADDAQHAQIDHWMIAEITQLKTNSNGARPIVLNSLGRT